MATGGFDMSLLTSLLPVLMVILIVAIIAKIFLTPLAPLLGIFLRRKKPIQQERDDYDMLFINDQRASAKANHVPARRLVCRDPFDPEEPTRYWGKIKGANMESDVVHLAVRRRFSLFTLVLFIPRDKLGDVHSRDLIAHCSGFRRVVRLFWMPTWGARMSSKEREKYRLIVKAHIDALYDEFSDAIYREETTAGTVLGMEPGLPSGRVPASREPRSVIISQPENVEESE